VSATTGSGRPTPEAPQFDRGPEPEFAVLGVHPVRHAAAPMLALELRVSEPSEREVYLIALRIGLMLEPARRRYDPATRERLVELFGASERWATSTRSLLWSQLDVLVPPFTGHTRVTVPVPCSYDLELAAVKYLHSLSDGEAPCALHFNGTIYYRAPDDQLRIVLVPWNRSIDFRLPVAVWRATIEHYYPNTSWVAVRRETLAALQREKLARGLPTNDACLQALLAEGSGAA